MSSLFVLITNSANAQVIEPPPGSPAPSSTSSGATRPTQACIKALPKMPRSVIALSPSQVVGFTRSSTPTIFIYLPNTKAQLLEFSLFNPQREGLYQTVLPAQKQAGLMSLSLPIDAPKLVKGQIYYWTVAIICNVNDRTEDQVISGWIQYRDFPQNVDALLPIDRIERYAQQGFWYDAFQEWSSLHQKQPDHPAVKKAWSDLIRSIGLPASLAP